MEMNEGERYGRLTVIRDNGPRSVECKCDCGNVKIAVRKYLRSGDTMSCGCLHREKIAALSKSHGGSSTRLYRIWKGMRTRATNRNRSQAKDYVLRGIAVCEEWSDFGVFREWAISSGYSDGLTIDRIDNDGPYSPGNCRWSTYKEQSRNKRNTHVFTYNGIEYRTIKDLCSDLGLNYRRTWNRIRRGWSLEDSIEVGPCKSGPCCKGQSIRERER